MSRYIDADKLVEYEEHAWDWDTVNGIETAIALRQVISDIRHEPTADVVDRNECTKCVLYPFKQLRERLETNMVEVVRCKDCKYMCHYTDGHLECRLLSDLKPIPTTYCTMNADDFCSYGERREEDDIH